MAQLKFETQALCRVYRLVESNNLGTVIDLGCAAQVTEDTHALKQLLVTKRDHRGNQGGPLFDCRAVSTQTGVDLEVHPSHLAGESGCVGNAF